MTAVAALADELAVSPGDVLVLAAQLDHEGPDLPDEVAAEVRDMLNPAGERSVG